MTLLESEHLIKLEKGFKEADFILEESAKTKQKVIIFCYSTYIQLILNKRNQEITALKKLDAIKKEQYSRVENLQHSQLSNIRKARLIENNVDIVDQAILVIRNAIASSMDWKDLENLVLEEKKKEN